MADHVFAFENERPQMEKIAQLAQKALLYEVALTPKPGLVDRQNNGAHDDMDFNTFLDSIEALSPFFANYLKLGFEHEGALPELFLKARKQGFAAETAMLKATHNINTHKGANFSFAVVLCALGYFLRREKSDAPFSAQNTEAVLKIAQDMTHDLVERDFAKIDTKKQLSYGEKLYVDYGLTGIRGEASQGYPTLTKILLPFWRAEKIKSPQQDKETFLLSGLVLLMSQIEDGNLIHRGGISAWETVKAETQHIYNQQLTGAKLTEALEKYDETLIARHLSPGGTADLLALGIFFLFLEGLL